MRDFSFLENRSESEIAFLIEHTTRNTDTFKALEKIVEKKYPKLKKDLERVDQRDFLNEV